MRKPRAAPQWLDVLKTRSPEIVEAYLKPEFRPLLKEANDKYLHWDKFRLRVPEGLAEPEFAWSVVKFSRVSQRQTLPLSFTRDSALHYWLPPRFGEWLHRIDKQAGGSIGGSYGFPLVEHRDMYLYNSLMEEAIASSQLEGAATTRKIAKQMLRSKRKPRNRAEQMIANNYAAILEVRDRPSDKLTPELLCHLQSVLTYNTLDNPEAQGRFRAPKDEQEHRIVVEDVVTHDTLHVPPPAEEVPWRIGQICDFANTQPDEFIHPAIKASILHFALGFVHPFVDGNGRTARAVFYWYMLSRGYWLFEFLPISRIVNFGRSQYARAYLYVETDEGDVTYFLYYHIRLILRAIDALHAFSAREQRKTKEAMSLLDAFPSLNQRQRLAIQESLKDGDQRFTTQTFSGRFHVTNETSRHDLLSLANAGLFKKLREGKRWVFVPADDLRKKITRVKARKQVAQPPTNQLSTRNQALASAGIVTPPPLLARLESQSIDTASIGQTRKKKKR